MLHPRLTEAVDAIGASEPPSSMKTKVVAIDGLGGSGKSSLAALLSRPIGAPVVHTDDFASWENPVDWWPALIEKVFEPLAEENPAAYRPTSWGGPPRDLITIDATGVVLVEGVTASRESFRPYLAFAIWVETPRELRLRRGLERDGADALDNWIRWMADEDAYVEREQPAAHVDVVLPGDAGMWT